MAKSDPFLSALLSSPTRRAPVATPVRSNAGTGFNFAAYFNSHAAGAKTNATQVGLSSQGQQDEQSFFSKSMSWLGSLGLGVENVLYDTAKAVQGKEDIKDLPKKLGTDVGAALVHAAQPVIDLGPIRTPWEKSVSNYAFSNNVMNHGKEYISGSKVIKQINPRGNGTPANAIGGLALDFLSDPTTYIGVGVPGKLGKTAKLIEAASEATSTGTKAEKAALAVEKGKQATQDSVFARPDVTITNPSKASVPKLDYFNTAKEADLGAHIKNIISDAPEAPIEARIIPTEGKQLNKGMQEILAAKGVAQTKSGKFIPLVTQKILNNISRAGGELAPAPTAIPAATGPRAVAAQRAAADFVRKAKIQGKVLKPEQQAKLFDRMFKSTSSDKEVLRLTDNMAETPQALAVRRATAMQMIKSAEDKLAATGHEFHDWNGSGLKLSDVVAEIPRERFNQDLPKVIDAFKKQDITKVTNPDIQEYIAQASARRNLAVGTVAKDMYDKVALEAAKNQIGLSPARYRDWLTGEAQRAYDAARPLGFTQKEANAFKKLFTEHATVADVSMLDSYDVIDAMGPKIARAFYEGKRDPEFIVSMNKALAKGMGIPYGRVGKILKPVQDVEESMARRLTTWYGRGSMIHMARNEFTAAGNWAKYRNQMIGMIRQSYSNDEVNAAWTAMVRGPETDAILDPRVEELTQKFRDYFENIIGDQSKLGQMVVHSTVIDSNMVASDLNRHLNAVGSKFRIRPSRKSNWLKDIQNFKVLGKVADGIDPTTFLYNFDLAIQRTLAEYNLVDDFAMRFGAKPGEQGFDATYHTHEISHGRALGYKFPKEEAQQFSRLLEDLRKGGWRPSNEVSSFLTTALRKWKSGVTIYFPAHHIRNLVGDTWLMWAAGINDPRVFTRAMRVIGSQRKVYGEVLKSGDFNELQKLIDNGSSSWLNTEAKDVIIKKGSITADELYHESLKRGLLLDAQRIEDLQGESLRGGRSIMQPFGGAVHAQLSKFSEYREHYIRLAHVIGFVEKNMPPSVARKLAATEGPLDRAEIMKPLFDKAAEEVRKWHPDGTDLTYWEQKYMRNIAPFYSWSRKAIPLLLESMVLKPAKVQAYPRAMFAVQQMMGIQTESPYQPFPEDQLFPDWLRAGGIGPIGDPQSDNPIARWWGVLGTNAVSGGQETGYTMVDPGRGALPSSMIGDMLGMGTPTEARQGLTNMINPLFRIPAELMTGHETNGAPIYTQDKGHGVLPYLMGVMPQTAPLQRFTGIGKPGQQDREKGPNWEALINALTGAGITGTGKYTKSAEYDARDRAIRLSKRN